MDDPLTKTERRLLVSEIKGLETKKIEEKNKSVVNFERYKVILKLQDEKIGILERDKHG